nr:AIPR family protein [Sporosarcina aquimarina]
MGDLTNNYSVGEYMKGNMEVYGYDYDEERRIFTVINFHFFQSDELQTLTKQQVNVKFNRLKRFIKASIEGLYKDLEETSEAYSLAFSTFQKVKAGNVDRFRLMVFTDGKATKSSLEIPSEISDGIINDYRLIDINYLFKFFATKDAETSYEIDLKVPYLMISNDTEEYQSYLSLLNGEQLYEIYDKFGQRLLEQNVRTFLQFRGGVNKGIRNTIEYNPELFFAYNNGITATASSIEIKDGFINKIMDFQIVNGGQTTSAIYAAKKNGGLDISNVNVQLKLTVVSPLENKSNFVSKVSEYANTQNKVNKSDFFSNSLFHKDMKKYSKRIWATARGGSQQRTHWYYERVRGEYLNEQAYLTAAERRQFIIENPKNQMIEKTFLAKSENSWLKKPNIVSKGAQYSFVEFADKTTAQIEIDQLAITEAYYMEAVAKIIMFKAVEKIISHADWYESAYRAQTVTYTIAYLSNWIEKNNVYLNFDIIWKEQELPNQLKIVLGTIAKEVYSTLTDPPVGFKNVGEWCKKERCWEVVKSKEIKFDLSPLFLKTKEEKKSETRDERQLKSLDRGIEAQKFIFETHFENWISLYNYYSKKDNQRDITLSQRDILKKFAYSQLLVPSEKQAKVLMNLYNEAIKIGWKI